jgi:hypothetical protein
MGFDLSATFGFGVQLNKPEEGSILTVEERDIIEDLYCISDSPVYITYGGTDDYTSTYVLHKDSIFAANWEGVGINSDELMLAVRKQLIFGSELQQELLKNDIVISGEHFKWWLIPLWF